MNKSLDELKRKIKGPVFSIVTPFKKDLKVDYESLYKYLLRIYQSGLLILLTLQLKQHSPFGGSFLTYCKLVELL